MKISCFTQNSFWVLLIVIFITFTGSIQVGSQQIQVQGAVSLTNQSWKRDDYSQQNLAIRWQQVLQNLQRKKECHLNQISLQILPTSQGIAQMVAVICFFLIQQELNTLLHLYVHLHDSRLSIFYSFYFCWLNHYCLLMFLVIQLLNSSFLILMRIISAFQSVQKTQFQKNTKISFHQLHVI